MIIVTSGSYIAIAVPDTSTVSLQTGLVTNTDGSDFYMGEVANGALADPQVHTGINLPDTDPNARPYLRWNGSAVVTGPDYADYQAQKVVAGKTAALAAYNAIINAGITIASTGTPALDGTYAVTTDAKAVIDGIYTGIKNGDGLPGGGQTFVFRDAAGNGHTFDATSFPNLAKAVRDFLYQAAQGQLPANPWPIP